MHLIKTSTNSIDDFENSLTYTLTSLPDYESGETFHSLWRRRWNHKGATDSADVTHGHTALRIWKHLESILTYDATQVTAGLPLGTVVKITNKDEYDGAKGVITHLDEGDALPYRVVLFGDGNEGLDWEWCSDTEFTVISRPDMPQPAPAETPILVDLKPSPLDDDPRNLQFEIGDSVILKDGTDREATITSFQYSPTSGIPQYLTSADPLQYFCAGDLERNPE